MNGLLKLLLLVYILNNLAVVRSHPLEHAHHRNEVQDVDRLHQYDAKSSQEEGSATGSVFDSETGDDTEGAEPRRAEISILPWSIRINLSRRQQHDLKVVRDEESGALSFCTENQKVFIRFMDKSAKPPSCQITNPKENSAQMKYMLDLYNRTSPCITCSKIHSFPACLFGTRNRTDNRYSYAVYFDLSSLSDQNVVVDKAEILMKSHFRLRRGSDDEGTTTNTKAPGTYELGGEVLHRYEFTEITQSWLRDPNSNLGVRVITTCGKKRGVCPRRPTELTPEPFLVLYWR